MKSLRGKRIWFFWNASYVHSVKFVRWTRMRMGTGRDDTNKIGIGAVVSSDWLFSRALKVRIPYGLRRGQYRISPYVDLYRSYRGAWCHKEKIRRPKP